MTGTPADCVNLAIYNLLDERPDFVVSGINIGINTGLGFFMASGTLGACFEANIARIPAIALSQLMTYDDHKQWYTDRSFNQASLERMEDNTHTLMPLIWSQYAMKMQAPTTWSFNLPDDLESEDIVNARLGHTFYGQCYSQRGDQYFHDLQRFAIDKSPDSDQAVVFTGRTSATHIDITSIGQDIPVAPGTRHGKTIS